MKTEELERSLRAEFEEQLNIAMAKVREDAAELQKNCENEFEKHRSLMEEAFRTFSSRTSAPLEFDAAFVGSIVEHLRLARDEGARITATAMDEAERLTVGGSGDEFGSLRHAVDQIKNNSTQASILNSLIDAAARFASRGAFFIVRNEHLVGWKAFAAGGPIEENSVREIRFPVSSNTIISKAILSLSSVTGMNDGQFDSSEFLGPLSFGSPEKLHAIPLCARGRAVAVLYVDGGESNSPINLDALETLVSVAGLRVELLAAAAGSSTDAARSDVSSENAVGSMERHTQAADDVRSADEVEYAGEIAVADEAVSGEDGEAEAFHDPSGVPTNASADFAFSNESYSVKNPDLESAEAEESAESSTVRSYREKTVDLPIQVSEEERRPHSDARRFARLLVSEIKLYNEDKVIEGRESGDIYEVLKEAIDRSREMYEKRVRPDVAAKFDYFHYELVNNLAEGNEEKLGAGYFAGKV